MCAEGLGPTPDRRAAAGTHQDSRLALVIGPSSMRLLRGALMKNAGATGPWPPLAVDGAAVHIQNGYSWLAQIFDGREIRKPESLKRIYGEFWNSTW